MVYVVKTIGYKGVIHEFIDHLGFVLQVEELRIDIADALIKRIIIK